MTILGIDVSAWQGKPLAKRDIDWSQVAAGYRFAYLKVTEGETYTSPVFRAQWRGAADAGLYPGPYHFAQPDNDPTDDADAFVEAIGGLNPGEMSPVLDLEKHNGLAPEALAEWARTWLDRVDAHTSRWCLLYTGPEFWRVRLCPAGQTALDLTSWRLWQAQYNATLSPMKNAPTWKPLIWQFTGSGDVPGVSGHCDVNRFLGTENDLRQLAGLDVTP